MSNYRVNIDLSSLTDAVPDIVNETVFPLVNQAIRALAEYGWADWKDEVWKARLWIGEKRPYFDAIQWRMTGPFSAEIWTDYRLAEAIETGRPERDLKRMLDSSLKVRLSRDGKRYLIIPFRHNTPGHDALARSMPDDIYQAVGSDAFEKTLIVGRGWRQSGTGAWSIQTRKPYQARTRVYRAAGGGTRIVFGQEVPRKWGDRLSYKTLDRILGPGHGVAIPRNLQGMVRMNTSSGRQKSSVYLTFRTMAEGSSGWIVGPRPGLLIAQGVTDRLRSQAGGVIREAVRRSVIPS